MVLGFVRPPFVPPPPHRVAAGMLRRVCAPTRRNAAERYCRTRRQNAHVTERLEVLYPWHPWFGVTVHVHKMIEKGLSGTLLCSVNGAVSGRWVELPAWMFDRAVCQAITLVNSPRVHSAALQDLRKLLMERKQSSPTMVAADSGAQKSAHHQNRRSADAQPAPRFEETAAPSSNSVCSTIARSGRNGSSCRRRSGWR